VYIKNEILTLERGVPTLQHYRDNEITASGPLSTSISILNYPHIYYLYLSSDSLAFGIVFIPPTQNYKEHDREIVTGMRIAIISM